MAQLWGGRFTKETDKLVYNFNASISFFSDVRIPCLASIATCALLPLMSCS